MPGVAGGGDARPGEAVTAALACVACAYTLPVTAAATVTSLLEPVVAMILAAATTRYLRRTTVSLRPVAGTAPTAKP